MISLFSKQARKSSRGYITRTRLSSVTCMLIGAVLFLGPLTQLHSISSAQTPAPVPQTRQQISLPTPRSHYDTFKPGTTGLPLLLDLLKEFEPETQKVLLRFAIASGLQDIAANPELAAADLKKLKSLAEEAGLPNHPPMPKEQAIALLKQANWATHRPIM